jgi:hypothetical protein
MPDICDLILDDHSLFRRRFAELDELHGEDADSAALEQLWRPVAELLELHAAAEEALFYPRLVPEGDDGESETEDGIKDHNKIRDAVAEAAGKKPGSQEWWEAVNRAREENSDHMAEEERGALADFRQHAEATERASLGEKWLAFKDDHAGAKGIDSSNKDPESYIAEHR